MPRPPLPPPLALFFLLGLSPFWLSACSTGSDVPSNETEPSKALESHPVETGTVILGPLVARYSATATLQAEDEAHLVSEVSGTILTIRVEEGDTVKKGQILAQVDAARSRLQLRESAAELKRLENTVERGEVLLARKIISMATQDQARAELAVRRAEVALARSQVDKSDIKAPFDGVITRRWIKQGHLLKAMDPVFDMADFEDLRAEMYVPERDAVALAPGQPVALQADAVKDHVFEAVVERVAPVVERESGTVKVTIRIDNREKGLRPGMFVRLAITFHHENAATLVPKVAVMGNRGDEFVYVIEDGHAHRQVIRTGYAEGSHLQVLAGLEPGATVVVTGQASLRDADTVEVLKSFPG